MDDIPEDSDEELRLQKGLDMLREIDECPRNVTTTSKEIIISDYHLDCFYNPKMEKVRETMQNSENDIQPI